MKLSYLTCLLVAASATTGAQQATEPRTAATTTTAQSATTGRTIAIAGSEQMKYDVATISARPGEQLHVVLKAVGSMPKAAMAHNFVLLKAGVSPLEVANASMTARDTDFIPPAMKDKIIASTGLAGGGETVEVTFRAPTKAGTYAYLCTFPGHLALGMKGELVVK